MSRWWPFGGPAPTVTAPTEPPPSGSVGTFAHPLVVNPNDEERIAHALYRVDAIIRYIQQTEEISEAKMAEFRDEFHQHTHMLMGVRRLEQGYVEALRSSARGL